MVAIRSKQQRVSEEVEATSWKRQCVSDKVELIRLSDKVETTIYKRHRGATKLQGQCGGDKVWNDNVEAGYKKKATSWKRHCHWKVQGGSNVYRVTATTSKRQRKTLPYLLPLKFGQEVLWKLAWFRIPPQHFQNKLSLSKLWMMIASFNDIASLYIKVSSIVSWCCSFFWKLLVGSSYCLF